MSCDCLLLSQLVFIMLCLKKSKKKYSNKGNSNSNWYKPYNAIILLRQYAGGWHLKLHFCYKSDT